MGSLAAGIRVGADGAVASVNASGADSAMGAAASAASPGGSAANGAAGMAGIGLIGLFLLEFAASHSLEIGVFRRPVIDVGAPEAPDFRAASGRAGGMSIT
jgi:hypothetical protein